ncbi:hypothetical protein DL98DRAFT_437971 [Cadophora sp. DSE1049]|nr:hypothetical protein DL98DRAFT_437971 [Cadophora sp. DSE1049]
MAVGTEEQIHWRTPASMVGSLLIGCLFAIGHHLFYQSLTGKLTTTYTYTVLGANLTSQQVNIAAGTAFAFLVRACLVSSVSLAYLQAVWYTAKNTRQSITLANMDVLLSALSNALSLADVFTWWKWPWLLLVALLNWLIPIAAIFTPATLSVGVGSPPPRLLHVPQVAFTSLSLLADMHSNGNGDVSVNCWTYQIDSPEWKEKCTVMTSHLYNGPSYAVTRVVAATAAQGAIIPVVPPAANSSWTLDFLGPSIKCHAVDDETRAQFKTSIANFTFSQENCDRAPGYLAWTPRVSSRTGLRDILPYLRAENKTYSFNTVSAKARFNQDLPTLFVAVVPSLMEIDGVIYNMTSTACSIRSNQTDQGQEDISRLFGSNTTMLRCDLYNSTYQADFDFVNGIQQVRVAVSNLEDTPLRAMASVYASSYQPQRKCDILNKDNRLEVGELDCPFEPSVLRTLSYQAVMDAFTQLLGGTLHWSQDINDGFKIESNTTITSTSLIDSPELAFLSNLNFVTNSSSWPSLQNIDPQWNNSLYHGLSNKVTQDIKIPLQTGLETLFQNITISLASSPSLQFNASSAFFPPPTNVKLSTLQNIYVYSSYKLWLAYGLAISASTTIVVFGLVAIFLLNHASYSQTFSSSLRLARGAEMSVEVEKSDLDGRDPLPKYLEESSVKFR